MKFISFNKEWKQLGVQKYSLEEKYPHKISFVNFNYRVYGFRVILDERSMNRRLSHSK